MNTLTRILWAPLALVLALAWPAAFADSKGKAHKPKGALAVLVLGSGGPTADRSGRASAGYLVFVDGKPLILMDAGGGTFQRLAASGVNIKDLKHVLISHLHVDHTADIPAFVKTVFFHAKAAGEYRTAPIHFYGPDENTATFPGTAILQYPATTDFVDGHYHMQDGLYRYLNAFAPAIDGGEFNYLVHDLPSDFTAGTVTPVFEDDGVVVESIPVKHGPAPSLAYRIEYKGHSIVFSGDTNSETDNMIEIAQGADLLIYDTAILDQAEPVFLQLHTTPTRMGQVAAAAEPRTLVFSHITPATDPYLGKIRRIVKQQGYDGRIFAAKDLALYELRGN